MSDFRKLDDQVYASPQISAADVREAQVRGVRLIINNRPDGESDEQTPGQVIEAAARAAGIDYVAIPITHGGFSHGQVAAMTEALGQCEGPVLAYCRSGTRSTFLWALAQASEGRSAATLSAAAEQAGYDLSPVRAMLEMLSSGRT